MAKKKETTKVWSQKCISENIFDMWIETSLAREAKAGQFISVYPKNQSTLLPRPISICEADVENERLRIVYRVVGKGTDEFSKYQAGESISILGTLGNGFPLEAAKDKRVVLMGGGIGVPPMLETAKRLQGVAKQVVIVMGYRNSDNFLIEDFKKYGSVYIATEDGSVGTKGNVLDAMREKEIDTDVIFACGPMPMLRAIKGYASEKQIQAYISLEERMACGVGACLGCVVKTKEIDHHSHVNNARICTDGPVYLADDVEI